MKHWLTAFCMCQSMFCYLPFPGKLWDEKARDTMLLCLPVVGLEIGLLWWVLSWFSGILGLPQWIRAALLGFYPYVVTGYMHLDGFMDVTDAVKSWRSLERRREILKDSHVGSFAVIAAAMLLIAQFAVCASIDSGTDLRCLILVPVVSRCLSILAVMTLPPMQTSQYAGREKSRRNTCIPGMQLIVAMFFCCILGWKVAVILLAECLGFALALRRAYRSLEGMNGDISGYSITIAELTALAAMVLL